MDDGGVFGVLLVVGLVCGFIGLGVADSKGRGAAGFFLGLLLGPIGIIVAAVLAPSAAVRAQRDEQLAGAIARASGAPTVAAGTFASLPSGPSFRQEAIAEAILREPSLAEAARPDELARLAELTDAIEGDLRLKHDLATVKARQAQELENARQEAARAEQARRDDLARQERTRLNAAEQQRAAERAEEQAAIAAAARAAVQAKRAEHAETLRPMARTVYLHRKAAFALGVVVAAALVLAVAIPMRAAADRAEGQRLARAAGQASASASASASSASASASASSASASASSASASSAAASLASVQAAAAAKAAAAAEARRAKCLKGAKGRTVDLAACDLSRANLSGLNLSGRDLTGADLSGATLTGVILDKARLRSVTWTGARCPDGTSADENEGSCAENLLEVGEKLRPLKVGQSARVGDWTVTVKSFQANNSSNATAVAAYNREPGTGHVYAILKVEVKYRGTGQGMSSDIDFQINDVTDAGASCHVYPWYGAEILNTDQSASGNECLYLLSSQTKKGTIRATQGYSFEEGPSSYWAIP